MTHLAVARPVNLDARVAFPLARRRRRPRRSCPRPQCAQNLSRARVVGRVVAEGLARAARADERLNDPVRRPGLGASRLEHERRLQSDGRDPERVDARRVARQDDAERMRAREEAQSLSAGRSRSPRRAPRGRAPASGRVARSPSPPARRESSAMFRRAMT